MNYLSVFLASALTLSSSSGAVISQWTFETTKPTASGPLAPEIGSGVATGFHHDGSAAYSNPTGNGSSESWGVNRWSTGDYFEFSLSTLGYQNLIVNWDQTSTGTGPRDFRLAYSTDGTTFSDLSSYTVLEQNSANGGNWSSATVRSGYNLQFDLSSMGVINDADNVYFRLINSSTTSANGGTVGTSGAGRIDNFTVTGTETVSTTVPDQLPFSCAAVALLGTIVFARRLTEKRTTAVGA